VREGAVHSSYRCEEARRTQVTGDGARRAWVMKRWGSATRCSGPAIVADLI
jgi:hypothetical protein